MVVDVTGGERTSGGRYDRRRHSGDLRRSTRNAASRRRDPLEMGRRSSDVRWSIVLTPPQRDCEGQSNDDELEDIVLHCEGVPSDMPNIDGSNDLDDSISTYVQSDCEGTWIPK
ncbi:uncharacterized protein E5676_scaffold429G00160 [Cucumis melo var. makuwa]|uniref:Uncharacterized protein n=1 Tax=Cucumis melo var. makuwa TaxID=1194695 RepID=A0A5D3BHU1_CUCMM|nr:uncharacterized protein E6C27_scaffold35G00600 [Cucumis melo var. makuwa]TYJ98687.1 uncharacterized protein E5676_scaffold429G00160 [Cucumis melo var. makuwa]